MSALLNSGRSSAWEIDTLTVRFRPIADVIKHYYLTTSDRAYLRSERTGNRLISWRAGVPLGPTHPILQRFCLPHIE
jgi:hypothetical protein